MIIREGSFTVEVQEASDFFLSFDPSDQKIRKPDPIVVKVTVNPLNGYIHDTRLEVIGAVLGPVAQFSKNPIGVGSVCTITIPTEDFSFAEQPFTVTVRGTEVIP